MASKVSGKGTAKEPFHESRISLLTLLDNLPGFVYRCANDRDWTMEFISDGCRELTGYSPEDFTVSRKISYNDLVHADHREWLHKEWDKAIKGKRKFEGEYRLVTAAGKDRWVWERGVAIRPKEGNLLYLEGFVMDVTPRKKAMEDLGKANERLVLAQRSAGAGIWDFDIASGKTEWSPELFHLFGLDPSKHSSALETWRKIVHPDDLEAAESRISSAVERHARLDSEYRIVLPDGGIRWIHALGNTVYATDGSPLRITGICLDITDRKMLEERLRHSEKMTAIGRLAGGIANDFNNQLAAVLGYSDILLDRIDDPVFKQYAKNIKMAALRSADLTRQLLAFGRKGKSRNVPVDMHSVIREVKALLEHTLDKRISMRLQLDAARSAITGDPSQMQNAVLNLALNARGAMPDGGILTFSSRNVHIREHRQPEDIHPGDYIEISVSDTGAGMDAEAQKHIFEPFFSTKWHEGTGLGLASVYGTMKNHGGAIKFTSLPGEGNTFMFCLPLRPETSSVVKTGGRKGAARPKARILVVDDEPLVLKTFKDMLRLAGHSPTGFGDPDAALAAYRRNWRNFDLVIIDMSMPRKSGRDLFREMRAVNPRIRALLASGYTLDSEMQKTLDEGILGFLGKPFNRDRLAKAVSDALAKGPQAGT